MTLKIADSIFPLSIGSQTVDDSFMTASVLLEVLKVLSVASPLMEINFSPVEISFQ